MAFAPTLDLASLSSGLAAFLPGLAAIFILYAPYDGSFKDNVIFLWFLGGLLLGTALGVLEAWVLFVSPLLYVLGGSLIEQGTKLAFLNQRRYHGERQSVWNGGAFGAGVGTMIALVAADQIMGKTFTLPALGYVIAVAVGIGFVQVATGLGLGAAVLREEPFRALLVTVLGTIPATLLVLASRSALLRDPVFALLLVGYGIAALWYARRAWLPQGASPDDARRMRRAVRERTRPESPP
ncbi:MAG: hypothetical protein ACYDDF_01890 [Thermoplasmatota archaeon]